MPTTIVEAREDLVPPELLAQIVRRLDPVRVILFGSHARGEAGPDSDLDLLVVLDDDASVDDLGWRAAWEARRGFPGAVDIVPCRRIELERRRHVVGSLAHTAATEGVVVYERG
jgi:predicted nucleotidyltransferase